MDKIEHDLWNCLANTEKVSCNLLDREAVERHIIEGKTVLVLRIPRADRRPNRFELAAKAIAATPPYKRCSR